MTLAVSAPSTPVRARSSRRTLVYSGPAAMNLDFDRARSLGLVRLDHDQRVRVYRRGPNA